MWYNAFRFMIFDKSKLIGILFGIVISVFLIGAQLGIFDSILDSTTGITKGNADYIFVVNSKSVSALQLQNIDVRVGYELQSLPGVLKVYPVVLTAGTIKLPSGATGAASIIGLQGPDFIGGPKEYTSETDLGNLLNEGAVILDKGDLTILEGLKMEDFFLINDTRVFLSGMSVNNPGFGQVNIVTTIERARQLSGLSLNFVSAYMVKTNSADALINEQIAQNITQVIPSVKAAIGAKFMEETLSYMMEVSSISVSFGMLIGVALLSGLVIVGLTMFSSVNDRIKDYGTVKAIGGGNGFIIRLILTQAAIYALTGFTFAMCLLWCFQQVMISANQGFSISLVRIMNLLLATAVISVTGSWFSLRKILKLEPVQIFRM